MSLSRQPLLATVALLAGSASPARPQDLPEAKLGDPIRNDELGVEFRLPRGSKAGKPELAFVKESYLVDVGNDAFVGRGRVSLALAREGETLEELMEMTKVGCSQDGMVLAEERKGFDPRTGASGYYKWNDPATGWVLCEHFYRGPPGLTVDVRIAYYKSGERLWGRLAREILYSFRVTRVPDDRLKPPEGAERVEDDALLLLHPKAAPAAAVRAFRDDAAAALGLVRDLTGGPAVGKLRVHLFPDVVKMKAVWEGAGADLPAALYFPQGRLLFAHVAPCPTPARTLGSRCEGVLAAYLDATLGTPFGIPPWLETGLREGARAARKAGGKLVADTKSSPLADWIRKGGRKASFPPIRVFLEARASEFTPEKAEFLALAMAVVLASRASKDEKRKTIVPRFLEDFRRYRDPDLAMATALEGVDLDALEAEARSLLAKT